MSFARSGFFKPHVPFPQAVTSNQFRSVSKISYCHCASFPYGAGQSCAETNHVDQLCLIFGLYLVSIRARSGFANWWAFKYSWTSGQGPRSWFWNWRFHYKILRGVWVQYQTELRVSHSFSKSREKLEKIWLFISYQSLRGWNKPSMGPGIHLEFLTFI